jgi:hypothetical protein
MRVLWRMRHLTLRHIRTDNMRVMQTHVDCVPREYLAVDGEALQRLEWLASKQPSPLQQLRIYK